MQIIRVCQHCGNIFIAQTTVTKYCGDTCSKKAYKARKKAEKIEENNKNTAIAANRPILELQKKELLSIKETCQLYGISRTTVWRLIKSQTIRAANLGKKKLILRASIDTLFFPDASDTSSEEVEKKTIAPFEREKCYSLSEVRQLFHLSDKALYDTIKRHNIPKHQRGKQKYVPKESINKIFGELQ